MNLQHSIHIHARAVFYPLLLTLLIGCGGEQQSAATQSTAPSNQTIYEWKMITSWPKNLPALGTSPEYFADIVEKMSNDRMQIRVYGANELVGGLEVFDAVSQGVAEIGHTGAYYWQGKIPGTPFFSSIPFGMTSYEQDAWLRFGGGNELWREILVFYSPYYFSFAVVNDLYVCFDSADHWAP